LTVQMQVVEALMKPEAYEEESGQIELKQTHISFVFLTRNFVYKVKKAVDFGFLDFSTLEKRHFFCEKELELNRRLCGDMYLGVVPVNRSDCIKINGEGDVPVLMYSKLSFAVMVFLLFIAYLILPGRSPGEKPLDFVNERIKNMDNYTPRGIYRILTSETQEF